MLNLREFKKLIKLHDKLQKDQEIIIPNLAYNYTIFFDKYKNAEELEELFENKKSYNHTSIFGEKILNSDLFQNRLLQKEVIPISNIGPIDIYLINDMKSFKYESLIELHKTPEKISKNEKKEDYKCFFEDETFFKKEMNNIINSKGILYVLRRQTPTAVFDRPISYFTKVID